MTLSRRLLQLCFCRRNYRAGGDRDLINALQSEIQYEQSSNPFQIRCLCNVPNVAGVDDAVARRTANYHFKWCPITHFQSFLQSHLHSFGVAELGINHRGGSLGDFVLDWDAQWSQDAVLRRKYGSGEEIAISALLGPVVFEEEEGTLPRKAFMKICMRKPGSSPILQFDCTIFSQGYNGSDFDIQKAYYLPSAGCLRAAYFKGPVFSSLDPELQKAFKEYLVARGITDEITNFLLLHLHKKEQSQYVNWLEKLERML
ncbi:hypothetical protein ACLOJK_000366 [Asimina triloba]